MSEDDSVILRRPNQSIKRINTFFAVRAGNREGQEENAEPVNVVR